MGNTVRARGNHSWSITESKDASNSEKPANGSELSTLSGSNFQYSAQLKKFSISPDGKLENGLDKILPNKSSIIPSKIVNTRGSKVGETSFLLKTTLDCSEENNKTAKYNKSKKSRLYSNLDGQQLGDHAQTLDNSGPKPKKCNLEKNLQISLKTKDLEDSIDQHITVKEAKYSSVVKGLNYDAIEEQKDVSGDCKNSISKVRENEYPLLNVEPKPKVKEVASMNLIATQSSSKNAFQTVRHNFRIPTIKKFYPLLSKLHVDTTALELYEFTKVTHDPLELLNCFNMLMEMESTIENLQIIKIMKFQLVRNITSFKKVFYDLLINCFLNIFKYQAAHHKDPLRTIRFKNKCCVKVLKHLSKFTSSYNFYQHVMLTTCEYIKILVALIRPIGNSHPWEQYKQNAFLNFYISGKSKFPVSEKFRNIRQWVKDSKYDIRSFKCFLKSLFKIIGSINLPEGSDYDDEMIENYRDLQIFIESSLIIINDIDLLKKFKILKLEWIHKAW